ncbi:MAG: hypothetical protein IT449_00075 [Phycisphaerales bacterium]|nr:hypothetical protein [Phycisphaerales bacterium]
MEPTPAKAEPPPEQPRTQATEPIKAEAAPALKVPPLPSEYSYGPGHPWHYYREGDNAPPIPFDDIPASEESGRAIKCELPKPKAKRIIAIRERLVSERCELDDARLRYQEIIERGAAALSRYDREIAYGGNDEMARAGTLALLFNQVAGRKGRIAFLEGGHSGSASRAR